ncbi:hypothetical protein LQ938_08415 [Microbacterium sp. cx-55]|uniref:hypothetical protein n=1 Tax=Microbacterium sp. cx-55 TaxID=2875948 RepID=UPI001CBDC99A|nr:hypothetical protein [Microbacterium sp. cx-55]MBZ4486211.1 hypothetical protein [Microbacterium sp. cx-55]UGB33922.1 hypothetical protein LQ938_08415 [Microbacterium sp. cx-55]
MRKVLAWTGALAAAVALVGCTASPSADDSATSTIPEAVESAGLGITNVWADTGVDGFSTVLSVGGTVDAAEIDSADLRTLISVVVQENTVDARWLELSLRDSAEKRIDIRAGLEELGADVVADKRISMDDAERIAGGGAS